MVNNPKIVLADEPTGALDSKTSVQVMELLKEVAEDRLIIMVTHNPELAQQYATRIITLKDGEIISDTDPYTPEQEPEATVSRNMGHASMNMFTALSLSFHNLWTKRSRTLLTAFAGSIGIIGIALIAALSSGVDDYIDQQEAKMAYQYPLLVETLNMDVSSMLSDLSGNPTDSGLEQVEVVGFLEKLFAMLDTNDLELLNDLGEKQIDAAILTNSVASSPNPVACTAYFGNRKTILNTGIHLWEYQGENSIHAKTYLIDDRMAIVGSFNMDPRSAYLDTEMMLAIDSVEFTRHLKQVQNQYLQQSLEIGSNGKYIEKELLSERPVSLLKWAIIYVLYLPVKLFKHLT